MFVSGDTKELGVQTWHWVYTTGKSERLDGTLWNHYESFRLKYPKNLRGFPLAPRINNVRNHDSTSFDTDEPTF